jgi:hypothetical protein
VSWLPNAEYEQAYAQEVARRQQIVEDRKSPVYKLASAIFALIGVAIVAVIACSP